MTGFVEQHAMSDQTFAALRRNYDSVGYTLDPTNMGHIVTKEGSQQQVAGNLDVGLDVLSKQGLENKDKKGVEAGKKRLKNSDPGDIEGYLGPWAGYEGEVRGEISGPSEEELKAAGFESLGGEGGAVGGVEGEKERDFAAGTEKTIFHGKSERDYLGRTYMHPPTDVDVNLNAEPGKFCLFLFS
jgi:pre-mRNA-processing factor 17